MPHLRLPTAPSIYLVSLALAAASGCALDGPPEPSLTTSYVACPDTGCNTNSAVVAGSSVAELDQGPLPSAALAAPPPYNQSLLQSQTPNRDRVRLRHLIKGDVVYRAHVVGDRLFALDSSGNVQLQGPALVGSRLVVDRLEDGGPAVHYVHIKEYERSLPFWISPGTDLIESFLMEWSIFPSPSSFDQPLCPPAEGDHEPSTPHDHYAIFFRGDRYDPFTKRVIAIGKEAGSWFNIACFKSVPAKLEFNRHNRAGATSKLTATRRQEQAMLKMYTADFCGKGNSYTGVGIPLDWENATGWQTLTVPEPISYEAVWGPEGALCLEQPRLDNADEILSECDLPSCYERFPSFPAGWQEEGYLLTANP